MCIEIRPLKIITADMNCFDAFIASLCLDFNGGYELLFSESWGFSIDINLIEHTPLLSNVITLKSNIYKLAAKYYGLILTEYNFQDKNELINVFKAQFLKQMPVLTSMDIFWDPGTNEFYKKINHKHHARLVVGINEKEKSILFYEWDTKRNIEYEDYFSGIDGCWLVNNKKNDILYYDLMDILCSSIMKLEYSLSNLNAFDSLRLFSNLILTKLDISKEQAASTHEWFIPICGKIGELIRGRRQFCTFLTYIKLNTKNEIIVSHFNDLLNEFEELISEWQILYNMMRKLIEINKMGGNAMYNIRKISDIILEIATLEEKIYRHISSVLK